MRSPSRHPPRASRTKAASMAAGCPPRCSRRPWPRPAQEKAAGVFDEETSRPRRSPTSKKAEGEKKAEARRSPKPRRRPGPSPTATRSASPRRTSPPR